MLIFSYRQSFRSHRYGPLVHWWVDVVIPLVTLVGGWLGNTFRYRHTRRVERAGLRQKRTELDQAQERVQEEADRGLLERAAALCRGTDREAEQGRALLLGMTAMGGTNPRVTELLDQMTQLELGRTVGEIQAAKAAGQDPEVVEFEVSDQVGITDQIEAELNPGAEREEASDGDDAQGDQSDPPAGGSSTGSPRG